MAFIDGENFTIRGQEVMAKRGIALSNPTRYLRDVFLWFPVSMGRTNIFTGAPITLQPVAIRSYYYTSVVGDDVRLAAVREQLWQLGFQPEVFKKDADRKRTKAVDIALTTDFLWNAFQDNYDVAVLFAGDGDYVPMVNAVKRLGKVVYVAFFYASGLSPALRLSADESFSIDDVFCDAWSPDIDGSELATPQ